MDDVDVSRNRFVKEEDGYWQIGDLCRYNQKGFLCQTIATISEKNRIYGEVQHDDFCFKICCHLYMYSYVAQMQIVATLEAHGYWMKFHHSVDRLEQYIVHKWAVWAYP